MKPTDETKPTTTKAETLATPEKSSMTTDTENNETKNADDNNNETAEQQTATPDASDAEENKPEVDPLLALEEANKSLQDKMLRLAADMENLRRRTEREKQDMAKYAITNFAKDILSVDDNLCRALTAVPDGAKDKDPALKALADGVEMTGRELTNVLERHGITRIDPKGEIFDPNNHQAMFELPNAEVPAGTILEVIASGFMIENRVLRPAMVGVAKGGDSPKKETPENQEAPENQTKENQTKEKAAKNESIDKAV